MADSLPAEAPQHVFDCCPYCHARYDMSGLTDEVDAFCCVCHRKIPREEEVREAVRACRRYAWFALFLFIPSLFLPMIRFVQLGDTVEAGLVRIVYTFLSTRSMASHLRLVCSLVCFRISSSPHSSGLPLTRFRVHGMGASLIP